MDLGQCLWTRPSRRLVRARSKEKGETARVMRLGLWRRWLRMNSRGLKFTALVVLGGLSLTVYYSGQPDGAKAALLAILAATTAIYTSL